MLTKFFFICNQLYVCFIGLWICLALFTMFTVVVMIKLFLQLRTQNQQYLPLHHRILDTLFIFKYVILITFSYLQLHYHLQHQKRLTLHHLLSETNHQNHLHPHPNGKWNHCHHQLPVEQDVIQKKITFEESNM